MNNKELQDYFFCMDKEIANKDPKEIGERLLKSPKKYKLTEKIIKEAYPNSIIYSGFATIEHPWFNHATKSLLSDGRSTLVKFVITRGGIEDWCIYHSLDANLCEDDYLDGLDHLRMFFMSVYNSGAKIHDRQEVERMVEFNDKVWSKYRH